MLKFISALALCLAAQPALALEVTGVKPAEIKSVSLGDFAFGPVTVRNISYSSGAVVMPLTDNKGKKYADVKLLSKAFYGKIEGCFKNGCAKSEKAPAQPVVRISSLKPLRSKVRVANAEVTFDGELLAVAGVMASKKEEGAFWVAFPRDLVFTDPSFKSAVESAVIAAWVKKGKK